MEEKRRILEWYMSREDVPDAIREKVHSWLADGAEDREIQQLLDELALSQDGTAPADRTDFSGAMRLKKAIRRKEARRRSRPYARILSIAAALLVLITATLFLLPLRSPDSGKTRLVAGSGISSYVLPDGTSVRMAEGSTLSYTTSRKFRDVELEGSAHFDVARDTALPFRVHGSDGSLAEVLGTSFSAVSDKGLKEVILKSGSVRVSLPSLKESITLKPDQRLSVEGKIVRLAPVPAASVCRWTEAVLAFDATPFDEVLQCLEFRYNVAIVNQSGVPPDKLITMTIGSEPLADVMGLLGELLPIRITIHDNIINIH